MDGASSTPAATATSGPYAGVLNDVATAWFSASADRPRIDRIEPTATPDDGPVIFIVVDTLRADRLGAYAKDAPPTPFTDRLATEGITFTNMFSDAPWTRPATASVLTGLYPSGHGVIERLDKLDGDTTTLAERMRKLGYTTGAVVANTHVTAKFGFEQGFMHWDESDTGWSAHAGIIVDNTLAWLQERPDPRFFLYLHLIDPHTPYSAPAEWEKKLTPAEVADVEPEREPPWERPPLAPDVYARTVAAYDAEIAYYESELLRLARFLDEKGWWNRATIIFTSDHAEAFGEHGAFRHIHNLWDEVLRVPLIVRSPRLAHHAGGTYAGLVGSSDLFPSTVELVGARVPLDVHGRSWLRRTAGGLDTLVTEMDIHGISGRVVRGPEGILVRHYPVKHDTFMAEVGDRARTPSANFTSETRVAWYEWPEDPKQTHPILTPPVRAARLTTEMERVEKRLVPRRVTLEMSDLEPDEIEKLKALGYMN